MRNFCRGLTLNLASKAKSPHLLPTFALPTRDMRRFKFGFRLKAKSEHEAALVRRWYGAGVELVWLMYPQAGAFSPCATHVVPFCYLCQAE